MGDLGSIHGLGRSPGEGKGYPLQCSGLENSMDCIVHGVTKSKTRLSDFHFHFGGDEMFLNNMVVMVVLFCELFFFFFNFVSFKTAELYP